MRRREFITLLGGAAASWPLAARAQQQNTRRVGVLMNLSGSDPDARDVVAALVKELQQLGWSDGRNVRIDVRWGGGDRERYRRLAAELAGFAPDAVVAVTTDVVAVLQKASQAVGARPSCLVNINFPKDSTNRRH